MERIDTRTNDLTAENVTLLGELFPSVITETFSENGTLRKTVDFDALREILGDVAEGQRERYQFTWPGKRSAKEEARRMINKTLRPALNQSLYWDDTENIYIEGDNLDALKLLRNTYAGKIRLIYIDPPYNTGHDFIYDDDFTQTNSEYNSENGEFDEDGGRLVANLEGNGRFHSDWCSMIYPRLLIARDLLSYEGAIFISIDENECMNLRKICDEIFGSNCFVGNIIWENFYGRSNAAAISPSHNNTLVYSKAGENWKLYRNLLPRSDGEKSAYKNPDNDPKGPWRLGPIFASGERHAGLMYEITTPDGRKVSPPRGSHWRMLEPEFWKRVEEGTIVFGSDGKGNPATKLYLSDVQDGLVPKSIWPCAEVGHTQEAKREVMSLFDGDSPFDTPKPVRFLKRIIEVSSDEDSYVLDFFSGSASMAHAVIEKNAEDGGKRKFILVQIPEETTGEFSNLCEIGEERIRRAGAKIVAEVEEANRQLKLGEEPKPVPDVGFRVLRIDSSNFTDTYATPDGYAQDQLHLFEDNVKPDRSDLDLLFQVLPTLRIPYSAAIEEIEVCGKRAFDVNHGQLVACFDVEVGADCIEEIAKMRPIYAVFRDASMADDATEANFEELFKTFSPDTVRKVI